MKKYPKPTTTTKTEEITPAIAEKLLQENEVNRNIRERKVLQYARDMSAGDWHDTGDPIRISKAGKLLDGQHRLLAIIKSGVTLYLSVVRNVEPQAQLVMDTGAPRQFADQLRMEGFTNTAVLASLLRWVIYWERGDRVHFRSSSISHPMLEAAREQHPATIEAANFGGLHRAHFNAVPASVLAMAHWLLRADTNAYAREFLMRVIDGVALDSTSPAYVFRERVSNDKLRGIKHPSHESLALLIYAWNAHYELRPITRLKLPIGGLTNHNYPMPRGTRHD